MESVHFFPVLARPSRQVLENRVLAGPDALVQNRLLQNVKALGTSFPFRYDYSDHPELGAIDQDHQRFELCSQVSLISSDAYVVLSHVHETEARSKRHASMTQTANTPSGYGNTVDRTANLR